MNIKKVLILGAGYLGMPLAWQLHRQKIAVIATRTHADNQQPFSVQKWQADDREPITQTADTWVFLLPPSACQDYAATVCHCIKQAQQQSIPHFILASSISVYGDENRHCDEHSPVSPKTQSAIQIVKAENSLINSDLANIDILRFGGLYDDQRHPIHYLLRHQKTIQAAQSPANLIHRQDAVGALNYAIFHPKGQRIRNIVAPEHPTKSAFYRHEAKRLHIAMPQASDDKISTGKIIDTCYQDFPAITHPIPATDE